MRVGLALSLLLHLLLLALYPVLSGTPEARVQVAEADPEDPIRDGIELVELVEVVEAEAPAPVTAVVEPVVETVEEPLEEAEPEGPAIVEVVEVEEPGGEPDPEEEVGDERTAAERLQPRMSDPRVWAPLPSNFTELDEFARAELLLHGMIQSWNDSMAIAEALSERARDWTFTDAQGRRWGLAPGRLYLGDFSIPLPVSLQLSPGPGDPWIRDDLARGAASAVIQETWTERARAIRERMELERVPPPSGADGG